METHFYYLDSTLNSNLDAFLRNYFMLSVIPPSLIEENKYIENQVFLSFDYPTYFSSLPFQNAVMLCDLGS